MTGPVAANIVSLWNRVGGQVPLVSIISDAQAMFGRLSSFDE